LKISSGEVEYVANLARLEITDKEKEKFTAQLNDILLYIDKLNELDTKGVEPMSHAIAICAGRARRVLPRAQSHRLMALVKVHILRCAATFVIATYEKSTSHPSGLARLVYETFLQSR
jgi:aspartyl-tRNA(Asn)/glutamyl-tRNA(Gln) amidotransferase subunit C